MIDREEALAQAFTALTKGPGDPTSVAGATVNALESIAWSLMGLLAEQTEPSSEESIQDSLKEMGLLKIGTR